jgi:hypothetical protein
LRIFSRENTRTGWKKTTESGKKLHDGRILQNIMESIALVFSSAESYLNRRFAKTEFSGIIEAGSRLFPDVLPAMLPAAGIVSV